MSMAQQRGKRRMISSISKALAAAGAVSAQLLVPGQLAAKPGAPVRAAGTEWTMTPGSDTCGLDTIVAGGTSVTSIGVTPEVQGRQINAMTMTLADRAPAGNYKIGVKVGDAAPYAMDVARISTPVGDRMLARFTPDERAAIASGSSLLIGLPDETIMVSTIALARQLPEATACRQKGYGKGLKSPPDLTRIVTWPKPVVSLVSLFNGVDYPQRTLQGPSEGVVAVVVRIGADGRVKECAPAITSHSNELDWAACTVLEGRARYAPGRNATGQAVESVDRVTIKWVMPVD